MIYSSMNFGGITMKENKFSWCIKQTRGLRLIEINHNLMDVYLRKSKSALNMLSAAMYKGELEWVLDTSYYAKYFAIYALYMKVGIKCEIHDCTISSLKTLFADILPYSICKELKESKELRVGALYYNKDFGKKQILARANVTAEFCLNVEEAIKTITREDIIKIRKVFQNT